MLSRNRVHCHNEEMKTQEAKVICKEGMLALVTNMQ